MEQGFKVTSQFIWTKAKYHFCWALFKCQQAVNPSTQLSCPCARPLSLPEEAYFHLQWAGTENLIPRKSAALFDPDI